MQEATLFKFALCGPEPYCSVLAADMLSFLWRCALSGCGLGLGAGLASTPLLQVGKCRSLSALCFPPGGHSEFCHTAQHLRGASLSVSLGPLPPTWSLPSSPGAHPTGSTGHSVHGC